VNFSGLKEKKDSNIRGEIMYCPKCQRKLPSNAEYCTQCFSISGIKAIVILLSIVFLIVIISLLSEVVAGNFENAGGLGMFAVIILILILFSVSKMRSTLKERISFTSVNKLCGFVKHFDGLPMPKGVAVNFTFSENNIAFVKDSQEILLDRSKILSADLVQGKDAKQNAMMGAMVGTMMVDSLYGAIYGSMLAKHLYFVITYSKDESVAFVTLDTEGSKLPFHQIAYELKAINNDKEKTVVEL
jgi:hypothetical protein